MCHFVACGSTLPSGVLGWLLSCNWALICNSKTGEASKSNYLFGTIIIYIYDHKVCGFAYAQNTWLHVRRKAPSGVTRCCDDNCSMMQKRVIINQVTKIGQNYNSAWAKCKQISYTAKKKIPCMVVLTTEWLPWLQETCMWVCLVLEVNCISNLSPNHIYLTTDNPQNSCEQVTTKILWWFSLAEVTTSARYYCMLFDEAGVTSFKDA